jgi:hypothetical protein
MVVETTYHRFPRRRSRHQQKLRNFNRARMNKTLLVACAVAGGLSVALAVLPPAQALPSINLGIEKNADAVTPVARRGGGFHRRGGFRRRRFRHGRYNRHRS